MLVLTRKKGERVVIGDDIVVTIIDVKGDSVRIGFDAPRGLPVQRAEIIDAVKAANLEAASAPATAGDQLRDLLGEAPMTAPAAAPIAEAKPAPATPRAPARRPGTDGA